MLDWSLGHDSQFKASLYLTGSLVDVTSYTGQIQPVRADTVGLSLCSSCACAVPNGEIV